MAAETQAQAPARKGCSVVAVIVVSIFVLILGLLIGAGGFYFYLQSSPEALEQLGIERPTYAAPADAEKPVAAVSEKPPAEKASADYALLYPIEESLRVEGSLDTDVVKTRVKEKRYELRKCYQKGLEKNPDLKGEMSVQFTVAGSNGTVIAAVERHTKFPSATVRSCILDELKSWEFKGGKKGQSVVKFDILMIPISSAAAEP